MRPLSFQYFLRLAVGAVTTMLACSAFGAVDLDERRQVKRLALLIAAETYQHREPAFNVFNDAHLLYKTLDSLDFEILTEVEPTRANIFAALRKLRNRQLEIVQQTGIPPIIVLYLGGHGYRHSTRNMFVPIDMPANATDGERFGIAVALKHFETVLNSMQSFALIIYDACRVDRLGVGTSGSASNAVLVEEEPGDTANLFLQYAASANQAASSRQAREDPYSPFIHHYVSAMDYADFELYDISQEVLERVSSATNPKQFPRAMPKTYAKFFFKRGRQYEQVHDEAWKSVLANPTEQALQNFIDRHVESDRQYVARRLREQGDGSRTR